MYYSCVLVPQLTSIEKSCFSQTNGTWVRTCPSCIRSKSFVIINVICMSRGSCWSFWSYLCFCVICTCLWWLPASNSCRNVMRKTGLRTILSEGGKRCSVWKCNFASLQGVLIGRNLVRKCWCTTILGHIKIGLTLSLWLSKKLKQINIFFLKWVAS